MEALIDKFYNSFANLDKEGLLSCYHEDIEFYDPAFGSLNGERAKAMWSMLIDSQNDKSLIISHSNVQANEEVGSANWEARYQFSKTGRYVHNKINASFEFKDGKIIRHADDFDLYRWSRQALGIPGYFIGWSSYFKNKLQLQTNKMLDKYIAKNS